MPLSPSRVKQMARPFSIQTEKKSPTLENHAPFAGPVPANRLFRPLGPFPWPIEFPSPAQGTFPTKEPHPPSVPTTNLHDSQSPSNLSLFRRNNCEQPRHRPAWISLSGWFHGSSHKADSIPRVEKPNPPRQAVPTMGMQPPLPVRLHSNDPENESPDPAPHQRP